jgi:hypothetical protein
MTAAEMLGEELRSIGYCSSGTEQLKLILANRLSGG